MPLYIINVFNLHMETKAYFVLVNARASVHATPRAFTCVYT